MADETLPSIIDFSASIADAEAPPTLPDAEYTAMIRDAKVHASKNTGKLMGHVKFLIAPEDYPVDFDPNNAPDGITMDFYGAPLEQDKASMWRLRQFLEAIGAPLSKQINVNDWLNLTCKVRVATEEYEGVKKNVVKSVVRT